MELTYEEHEEIRNTLKNAIFALNDKNYKVCKKLIKDEIEFFDRRGI